MQDYKAILEPEGTFHIYNRANGNEKIFANEGNYSFFLHKYKTHILPVANTFCYCLLPNHFHFLVRIKNEKAIETLFLKNGGSQHKTLTGFKTLSGLAKQQYLAKYVSQQFSHLFNGYTQAFNKQQKRHGSLFERPFNRKPITDEPYLHKLVHYIHYNPVEARLCNNPQEWKYSSYNAIVSGKNTLIKYQEVMHWFDGPENFIYCHEQPPEITGIEF